MFAKLSFWGKNRYHPPTAAMCAFFSVMSYVPDIPLCTLSKREKDKRGVDRQPIKKGSF